MADNGYYICGDCGDWYISGIPYHKVYCLKCGSELPRITEDEFLERRATIEQTMEDQQVHQPV